MDLVCIGDFVESAVEASDIASHPNAVKEGGGVVLEGAQMSAAVISGQAPERLRQLVSVQMERMPSREQRRLEATSVAGFEFSTAEVERQRSPRTK